MFPFTPRRTIMVLASLFGALLWAAGDAAFAASDTVDAPVSARQISTFKPGSEETRFGALEFMGGLEFTSKQDLMGSMSSLRFRVDGRSFLSVLDTGHWLTGKIQRDDKGRLSGLEDVAITPMRDSSGAEPRYKGDIDAEGVTFLPGQVLVSFERKHRVDVYPDPGFEHARPLRSLDILIPKKELRGNGSLETVVASPGSGPLGGAPLIVAERSLDDDGNLLAAVLDGPRKGRFKLVRNAPWDVTDGAFLPSGDLLLLERRFSFVGGVGMRIRRIRTDTIKPGALVDGKVLIEADMSFQIDNMEGIDVVAGADGHPHVILVSDDNHSILQRNLLLEFRLVE